MKKFIVSKSDNNKLEFLKAMIREIKPDQIYVLTGNERLPVFAQLNATILPLKDLNKNTNWIKFSNEFNPLKSLLIVDNILKFMFFGDGNKSYIKEKVQSFQNVVVMDVVPFYSEPAEIFYPFWFLGKSILGYNSFNSFKANHLEENIDGTINEAHSFEILKDKIKDYYYQDYQNFFSRSRMITFELNDFEEMAYQSEVAKAKENFTNPTKFYNDVSPVINLCQSRYDAINELLVTLNVSETVLVNNAASFQTMHRKKINHDIDYLTFHSPLADFDKYKNVVFMQMPIAKPMNFYYIASKDKNFFQIALENNKLESYYKAKIYNNELRKQIDAAFYHPHLPAETGSI